MDEDSQFYADYAKQRGPGPFLTADALVSASDGMLLLIERGKAPGKGKLALPGGFVGLQETFFQACVRELIEETGLSGYTAQGATPLTEADLERVLVKSQVFDDPKRSRRGRVVTNAFLFELMMPHTDLFVEAADDAGSVGWFPFASLESMKDRFFEDHWKIIKHFLFSSNEEFRKSLFRDRFV